LALSGVRSSRQSSVIAAQRKASVVCEARRHRVKRLPVVRNAKVVGIVARANLMHALATLALRRARHRPPTPPFASASCSIYSQGFCRVGP
jgi:CBS-domain-containing membrane protein